MKYLNKRSTTLAMTILTASLLSACGSSSDDDDVEVSYEVTLTNLTSNQPLSPLAVQLHNTAYQAWEVGSVASESLEMLAEGGDNTAFLAVDSANVYNGVSGSGAVAPGITQSLSISADEATDMQLTLVTMLVNTNDAFAGKTGLDLSDLAMGESMKHFLPVYDAGTEGNSELAGTIPGPADDGGEGFNMARDDVDFVARHPGVVGMDHGYSESVLNSTHSFDSPVAVLTVTRTQ
ncbi:MAG: spondin domain-containing protein [Bermanella sp.]